MFRLLIYYLIFPGFLFSLIVGLLSGWVDRKVTARLQWRKGPPWYQNFADVIKLLGKETILPAGSGGAFLLAPFLGFLSLVLASAMLGTSLFASEGFGGDLIVVLYLLVIPAIALIIGASASANPLASVGASREMKLVLAYELPFILSLASIIIKTSGSIQLTQVVSRQLYSGSNIASWSGALAFFTAIFCMQAKLGLVPFDASEAEQEIMAGALIEYSGLPLAIFKLTKALLLYTMPLFLIILFWAGNLNIIPLVAKYVAILVIIILIKNTNPRLRIDQALRFFWGPMTILAALSVILAVIGK